MQCSSTADAAQAFRKWGCGKYRVVQADAELFRPSKNTFKPFPVADTGAVSES